MEYHINADAGSSTDLSMAILMRAMLHAENSYYIPDASITGKAYKTNLASNTAFRGFGGPQGISVIENALDQVARYLKKDVAEIRLMNFYGQGANNIIPYGQTVGNNHLSLMYDKLIRSVCYFERRKEITKFQL